VRASYEFAVVIIEEDLSNPVSVSGLERHGERNGPDTVLDGEVGVRGVF